MSLEVELKAPLMDARKKVQALGAKYLKTEKQEDTYYQHPKRDFRVSDESLRIRKSDGYQLTYKGPNKSDDLKVREELEFSVTEDAYALLERLGFTQSFKIKKERSTYRLKDLLICLDNVEGLGEYIEVESSDPADKDEIFEVLGSLGVRELASTKTYSELLGY